MTPRLLSEQLLVENRNLIDKLADFETKKSVHVSMTKAAHAEFRKKLFDLDLSMQEVFEDFVQRILAEQPSVMKMLDEVAENKKMKKSKKFSKEDAESIFDLLENEDPFK